MVAKMTLLPLPTPIAGFAPNWLFSEPLPGVCLQSGQRQVQPTEGKTNLKLNMNRAARNRSITVIANRTPYTPEQCTTTNSNYSTSLSKRLGHYVTTDGIKYMYLRQQYVRKHLVIPLMSFKKINSHPVSGLSSGLNPRLLQKGAAAECRLVSCGYRIS